MYVVADTRDENGPDVENIEHEIGYFVKTFHSKDPPLHPGFFTKILFLGIRRAAYFRPKKSSRSALGKECSRQVEYKLENHFDTILMSGSLVSTST